MPERRPAKKYKGVRGGSRRQGLGRLRRANTQERARVSGLEREHEDSEVFDRLGSRSASSHQGESLLARFNRVVRSPESVAGEPGAICAVEGASVVVRCPDASERTCTVRQALKKQIAGVKNVLAVGDRVRWQQTDGGAVITGIEPRQNQLERADSHNRSLVHVFAANIDRIAIIGSVGSPEFKPGLVDRYLVIASANRIAATVVVNKSDLADTAKIIELYRDLGFHAIATCASKGAQEAGVCALREHLCGATCVFAGHSGVGKSSLVNALHPELSVRVGEVALAGHGRHTTTSARSYLLPGGGSLVDTPGIRECSITGLDAQAVAHHYPELARLQPQCRFSDCAHLREPGCAVLEAVKRGAVAASRWASYRAILTEDLGVT